MSLDPDFKTSTAGPRAADDFCGGLRSIAPVVISVAPYGLLLGTLAGQKGISSLELFFMSATVFAGGAQFVAIDLWSQPPALWSLVAVTLLVNLRHVLMGAALGPAVSAWPAAKAFGAAFFMADENWAVAMRRAASGPLTFSYYFGLALPVYVTWLAATTLGHIFGSLVRDPARYGFDFAFTAIFLALLTGLWRGRRSAAPWIASALAAVVAVKLLPPPWYILSGGLAGALVGALTYRPEREAP